MSLVSATAARARRAAPRGAGVMWIVNQKRIGKDAQLVLVRQGVEYGTASLAEK